MHPWPDARGGSVLRLGARNRGANDLPVFEVYVFGDGCVWVESGSRLVCEGRVPERIVGKILQDAWALGYFAFPETLLLEGAMIDMHLMVRKGSLSRTVHFSALKTPVEVAMAEEREGQWMRDLIVTHLLAARVEMIKEIACSVPIRKGM